MPAPKLLLLDLLHAKTYSQTYGEALPFVHGWAAQRGLDCAAVALGVARGDVPILGEPVPLSDADGEALEAVAVELGATHLLVTQPIRDDLRERLRSQLPELSVRWLDDRFVAARPELVPMLCEWLGVDNPEGDALLVDIATPNFGLRGLNDAARETVTPVRVIAGRFELYELPLSRSPFFKPDETDAYNIAGAGLPYPYQTPAVELAVRHVDAALATLPAERATREYMIHGSDVLLELETFAARAAERGWGPLMFMFSVHPDAVVAAAESVERGLPALVEAGHSLVLGNLGVENHSAAECERIAAPAGPADWQNAEQLVKRWEERYPGSFICARVGGFGVASFTPWTSLTDLRANAAAATNLDIRSMGYLTTTKLRLVAGGAAAERAERDGLLTESFEQAVFGAHADATARDRYEQGLPWRFADRQMELLYTVVARMVPDEGRAKLDDPYFDAVQKLRGVLPDDLREDPLAVLNHFLDAVELGAADGGHKDVRALLQAFLERVGLPDAYIALEEEDEDSGEGPPPEDDEGKRDAARIEALLGALDEAQRGRLQGYQPESVVAEFNTEGQRVIAVTMRLGEQRLVVNLLPRRVVRGSFAFTSKYAICYHQDTPIDTREKELMVQTLAELVEKATV